MKMKEITVDGVVYVQKEPTNPKHGWVVGHEYGWGRTDERRKCLEITEDGRAFLSPYPNDGYHIPYTWGNSWIDLTLQEEHAKDAPVLITPTEVLDNAMKVVKAIEMAILAIR